MTYARKCFLFEIQRVEKKIPVFFATFFIDGGRLRIAKQLFKTEKLFSKFSSGVILRVARTITPRDKVDQVSKIVIGRRKVILFDWFNCNCIEQN